VLNLDEGEPFGAVQLCNFSKLIGLADGDSGKTFCIDRFDDAIGIKRATKNFETAFTKGLTEIHQLHFEPAIGLIAAVAIERFSITKPVEWRFNGQVACGVEDRREYSFGDAEDVVERDERRFNVDLRKLRLPVG